MPVNVTSTIHFRPGGPGATAAPATLRAASAVPAVTVGAGAAFPGPDGAPAPWTVRTGYQNSPGYPGSLTTSSLSRTTIASNTTYEYLSFTGNDFKNIAGVSNVTFLGCRFLTNVVADASFAGTFSDTTTFNITFSYCTFGSSASNPPVAYGSGNQYCIDQRGIQGLTVDHCDMWGFGEAIELSGSSLAHQTQITNSYIHDASDNGGGIYHVDGILSNNGGSGIQYVTVSGNTIVIAPSNTNCIGFQSTVPGGSPYSNLTITGNYISGDNTTVDVGTQSTGSANITFTGNVIGSDYKPANTFVYNSGGFTGTGSTWSGNTYYVPASSPFTTPSAAWLAAGNSGLYWRPGDGMPANSSSIIGHVTDTG
jgi:hypothetical protein